MHFSFSAVNENADENEMPFSAQKRLCLYHITNFNSYGSVAKRTFSVQHK